MKRALVRNASLFARNVLLSRPNSRNPSVSIAPLAASNRPRLGLFLSHPDSSNESDLTLTRKHLSSICAEDVSDQELKRRIEKFYAGDAEAVPSIFEAILKRKLAGRHDEADNKLMEEICGKRREPLDDMDDEKFDTDEEFNSDKELDLDEEFGFDLDESSSETDEDFDAKQSDVKRRVRDE
ncbi:hypothetical protein I3842_16G083900 [Carya illinoinensis]|uniref:Uncharacterized protein n=1 Tax=Carya illinoinensis TaxID=32201 RepID=A0A922A172_CARIL|nr:hypothetical protein I3842_16G083900 [Carya illinoinensis]